MTYRVKNRKITLFSRSGGTLIPVPQKKGKYKMGIMEGAAIITSFWNFESLIFSDTSSKKEIKSATIKSEDERVQSRIKCHVIRRLFWSENEKSPTGF
jgi:hypothetical protein